MYIENIIIFNYRSCKVLSLELSEDSPNVFIESANFLKRHITSKDDIPGKIKEAFDKLRG